MRNQCNLSRSCMQNRKKKKRIISFEVSVWSINYIHCAKWTQMQSDLFYFHGFFIDYRNIADS